MLDLESALYIVNDTMTHTDFGPVVKEAWQTLKTAVLAQQTTNKQSTPCPVCKRKMVAKLVCTNKNCSCIYKN